MSLKMNSSTNFNGTSEINGETIATFDAYYNENKVLNINKSILLIDIYAENKEDVDADITEFENTVISKIIE